MKFFAYKPLLLTLVLLWMMPACQLDTIDNPNAPTQESLEFGGATINDLRLLSTGLESVMRVDVEFNYWTQCIIGREYWDLRQTDPRYTGELLGAGGSPLDNNGFLTTRAYTRAYRIARNAWVLIHATDNSAAGLTTEGKNGFKGFARTLLAFGLMQEVNRQYENGIRVDVENPDARGTFLSYTEALREIGNILDAGFNELSNAGAEFEFTSTLGDLDLFKEFNRALAARVAMYKGDRAAMRGYLNQTWMDADGDMDLGVYYRFGSGGNNILNPLYTVPEQTQFVVHPDVTSNAEVGDTRYSSKTLQLTAPYASDGLSSDVQVTLVPSNTSAFPILRNEELVLMWAESNIGFDNLAAIQAINKVRLKAGLFPYGGPSDDASLIDQLLHERRYSLYGEGHRWFDMRRFNRMNQIPSDRPGDVVHVQFPRPVLEQ